MRKDRNYVNKWGYGLKEILKMPRLQFANIFGNKYALLSESKFKKVITNETPYVVIDGNGPSRTLKSGYKTFEQDIRVRVGEHRSCQRFVWDEVNVFI